MTGMTGYRSRRKSISYQTPSLTETRCNGYGGSGVG